MGDYYGVIMNFENCRTGVVEDCFRRGSVRVNMTTQLNENQKRHMSVVFIGHVNAGKSTTVAHILLLSGQVDDITIQKHEKEAKDKQIESWYMNYILARHDFARFLGNPVEFGTSHFETETTRFTILDALGSHNDYVLGGIREEVQLLKEEMIRGKLHAS